MAWIETYNTKKGVRRRVRDRRGGKKTHQSAGPYKETAYDIRKAIEDDSVRAPLNLQHHDKTIAQAVEDFLKFCVISNRSPNTINQYKYSLETFKMVYGPGSLRAISAEQMESLKERLFHTVIRGNHKVEKFYTLNGIKIILRTVKVFFNYCKRHGYMRDNPARATDNLTEKEVWRILTEEEEKILLDACFNKQNKDLWEISLAALRTGMRENEIIIKLDDKHVWDNHIHFKPKETKRNKNWRHIPIIPEISFLAARAKSGRAYPGWTRNRLAQDFKRTADALGIGRIRFHDLKHTFCSRWLRRGGDIRELQEITGNDLKSLQKYLHIEAGQLMKKAEMIFPCASLGPQ